MKHLGLWTIAAFTVVLAGCGKGNGKEAGKAFVGAFGAASGAASGHSIARLAHSEMANALRNVGMSPDSLVWGAYFQSVQNVRRAKWCDSLSADASYSGTKLTCKVTCPSDTFTIGCTTAESFSAACGATTYTMAAGGTFGITWPNGETSATFPNPINVSMDVKISGGALTNAAVKVAFSFNPTDLTSTDASADICAHVTNFSGSIDGSSFSCGDLRDGTKECK